MSEHEISLLDTPLRGVMEPVKKVKTIRSYEQNRIIRVAQMFQETIRSRFVFFNPMKTNITNNCATCKNKAKNQKKREKEKRKIN